MGLRVVFIRRSELLEILGSGEANHVWPFRIARVIVIAEMPTKDRGLTVDRKAGSVGSRKPIA